MLSKRTQLLLIALAACHLNAEDVEDFSFSDRDEIMIAQESRQYQTIVKPPIKIYKPTGITNSHRPQYNIDSEEDVRFNRADVDYETSTKKVEKLYRPSYKVRSKEGMIRDAVLRALERKDHIGKFAQVLPIIRGMSGSQRVALASLVANQVSTPPGRSPLNLAQVRSMFGNHENTTTDLMLPILLDMANLFRKANKHGKQTREVHTPIQRRSDITLNIDPLTQRKSETASNSKKITRRSDTKLDAAPFEFESTTAKQLTTTIKTQDRNRRFRRPVKAQEKNNTYTNNTTENTIDTEEQDDKNATKKILQPSQFTTTTTQAPSPDQSTNVTDGDLTADSTNQTLTQDVPVAEKLRALNRYVDRKGNLIRRGNINKPPFVKPEPSRRATSESTLTPVRRRPPTAAGPAGSRQPQAEGKCELFTTSLCLNSEDYPTDAIVQSIRRNKAAAGALLADYRDPGDGAVDGVSQAQEARYTPQHYLTSNRRGDTANRDFASAGEAGFMCPSIVKYARPQRARATSGLWKYIVNTGEHTQTLRLEKCLKPKESCTYLTDNFKSKCVQVYNYHRLLTWDQQNGLHMDIFKVPTCCSCHIEGYSVNFPPLGNRVHETSSENFPEDIPSDHGNSAYESVQSSIQRPSIVKNPPPFLMKPLESFPAHSENHNLIANPTFTGSKLLETDQFDSSVPTGPVDSYGSSYFPDSFNQASSIKNVKRPLSSRNPSAVATHDVVTLPSYLEPPTPAGPSSFSFVKETPSKYKITSSSQYKRGAPRPSRRPIRKKISGAPDDLMPAGTSAVDSFSSANIETLEDFNDDLEEPEVVQQNKVTITPKLPAVTTEASPSSQQTPEKGSNNKGNKDVIGPNGKRVNYNYHPIIDFFEEREKEEDESIDREDSMPSYEASLDSEWKPINHPVNTGSNLLGRKKH